LFGIVDVLLIEDVDVEGGSVEAGKVDDGDVLDGELLGVDEDDGLDDEL
jgi:hypothetical protein